MASLDRATEFQDGISLGNQGVFPGTLNPSVNGEVAPLSSLYLRQTETTGELWIKTGSADTAWVRFITLADSIFDQYAIHVNASGEIAGLTIKSIPVASDITIIEDTESSNGKKKVSLGSTLSAIRPYFEGSDTPYQTTTSTSYVNTSNGSFVFNLETATYMLYTYCEVTNADANKTVSVRLLISSPQATWNRSGTTVTVTSTNHGLVTGDRIQVTVSSATTPVPLNTYTITKTNSDVFTFTGVNSGSSSGTLTYNTIAFENNYRPTLGDVYNGLGGIYICTRNAGSRTFTFQWLTSSSTARGRAFRICLTKLA